MQPTPELIARHTVDQNGGEYTTDVVDVLGLFGRQQLTEKARREIRDALQSVDVGTDPDLLVAERDDAIRLFVLQREWEMSGPRVGYSSPARTRTRPVRVRPRSWKGWLAYAVVLLVILGAVTQDSDEPKQSTPTSQTIERTSGDAKSKADAEARQARRDARRDRARLRKARAERRRAEAAARRERARARRARAEARQAREARLAAEAAAAEQAEPEPEPAPASCHPSYDPCLDPNASDYDCEGGSGDGPEYTGPVTVKGPDGYGLDSDGDGTGCE
jgi:hypothetical protein